MLRHALLLAAASSTLLSSVVHASDVSVYLPAGFLSREVDAQLEAAFTADLFPGTLSWSPTARGARLRQIDGATIGVNANLQYRLVIAVGSLMLPATVPATLSFQVSFRCRGVDYTIDAHNLQLVAAGVTFTGPALQFIEDSLESALSHQMEALDEALLDASTAYGVPMQSKCIGVAVGAGASLDYQFDVGCVEGTTTHKSCLPGMVGTGWDYQCVDREWAVLRRDCERPEQQNL